MILPLYLLLIVPDATGPTTETMQIWKNSFLLMFKIGFLRDKNTFLSLVFSYIAAYASSIRKYRFEHSTGRSDSAVPKSVFFSY